MHNFFIMPVVQVLLNLRSFFLFCQFVYKVKLAEVESCCPFKLEQWVLTF